MTNTSSRSNQIERLLASLNEWEKEHGTKRRHDLQLKSSGETNARIEELKTQLEALGAIIMWDGESYSLVKPVADLGDESGG